MMKKPKKWKENIREKQKQIKKKNSEKIFGDEKYFWQIFIQIYVIFYGSWFPSHTHPSLPVTPYPPKTMKEKLHKEAKEIYVPS